MDALAYTFLWNELSEVYRFARLARGVSTG